MSQLRILSAYFGYFLRSRFRNGYGVHSPFVFDIIVSVLTKSAPDSGLKKVFAWHRKLRKSRMTIPTGTFGAGSRLAKNSELSAGRIIRHSSVQEKYGAVLYRLAKWMKPSMIIEMGTGMGIGTAYLSAGHPEARLISVDADRIKSEFAQQECANLHTGNIEFVIAGFDEFLSRQKTFEHPMLVFIDGNHTREATLRYFEFFKKIARTGTVIVFDDIHWSDGMVSAWKEITEAEEVRISLNIFFMGIVLFREGIVKQNFQVKY